ncbi:MAG: sulfatase [Verrucomicrobia bacterium]|nr:sulfatase [Verrucomicrobiota bacterium]
MNLIHWPMNRLVPLLCLSSCLVAAQRPNVLLICVDDLKPTLGCYGDSYAKTPHMDRLSRRGTVFRSAYVQQAVCAPSRNGLMTGLRPDQIGVYDLATWFRHGAKDAVTLSQRFIEGGYHAESLGKIYHRGHGNVIDPASWSVKFWYPTGGSPAAVTTGGPKPPPGAVLQPRTQENGRPRGPAWGWPDAPDAAFGDGKIARHAADRLAALASEGKSFFLGVGFARPHLPFIAPKRYWDLFDHATLPVHSVDAPLPKGTPSWVGHNSGELRSYSDIQATGPLTPEQARTMVHGYYAATAFVDAQIGVVLDALDRLELWQKTIVVLWGDHGWHLGDHGLWCKHTNFEQATRNPIIIVAPGKPGGQATDALVQTVDLYPTLCALAGLEPPPGLPGKSLVRLLDDPAAQVQDAVFQVYPRGTPSGSALGRAVRTARHRYVEWRAWKSGAIVGRELYDYQTDPGETENLAEQPEQAALVARLARRLEALGPAKPPVAKDPSLVEPAGAH